MSENTNINFIKVSKADLANINDIPNLDKEKLNGSICYIIDTDQIAYLNYNGEKIEPKIMNAAAASGFIDKNNN